MKNSIFILFVFITFLSCNTKDIIVKNGQVVSFKRGVPNGIFINDTLSCDATELDNYSFQEYLYWIRRVYGIQSKTYMNALPDTLAIKDFFKNNVVKGDTTFSGTFNMLEDYVQSPTFRAYPIVGLTYEQTINYSDWRTDRVLEITLLDAKLITAHLTTDSLTCFTVNRYAKGQYFNHKPHKNLYFAKFRLPAIEEWELCAKQKNGDDWGIDSTNRAVIKYKKEEGNLFLTREVFLSYCKKQKLKKPIELIRIPFCAPVRSMFDYPNHAYHFIGNVAEMTSSKGIAKGGSWFHTLSESKISNNIPYEGQQAWLGFRNVCTWEKLEVR
jgi:hypothetical protein